MVKTHDRREDLDGDNYVNRKNVNFCTSELREIKKYFMIY